MNPLHAIEAFTDEMKSRYFEISESIRYRDELNIRILYKKNDTKDQEKDHRNLKIIYGIYLCNKSWNEAVNSSTNQLRIKTRPKKDEVIPVEILNLEKVILNHISGRSFNYKPFYPYLNWEFFTKNERKVMLSLSVTVPCKIISYKELGEKAGFFNAARFIGNTMMKNPFPLILPCHRVVPSIYIGDRHLKRDTYFDKKGQSLNKKSTVLSKEKVGKFQCGSDLKHFLLKTERC